MLLMYFSGGNSQKEKKNLFFSLSFFFLLATTKQIMFISAMKHAFQPPFLSPQKIGYKIATYSYLSFEPMAFIWFLFDLVLLHK